MKVMVMGKATKESEAGVIPPEEKWKAMGQFNQELIDAGILVAAYGLHPSSKGVRVHFTGTDCIISDGPFAETKELIAGYSIWEVKSMEEAIAWVKRCPMTDEADIEIRPILSPEDIGEAVSPEVQEQVEGRWAQVAAQGKK